MVRMVAVAAANTLVPSVRGGHGTRITAVKERRMLKILGWIVLIIFIIGLLVVFGVIDLIF